MKKRPVCEEKNGFTLLELIMVVIIIGVLASLAIPKMYIAVEKSRAAEAINIVSSYADSCKRFFLERGTWPTSGQINQLDIELSPPPKYFTAPAIAGFCGLGECVYLDRTSGPYATFRLHKGYNGAGDGKYYCVDVGGICEKLGNFNPTTGEVALP